MFYHHLTIKKSFFIDYSNFIAALKIYFDEPHYSRGDFCRYSAITDFTAGHYSLKTLK